MPTESAHLNKKTLLIISVIVVVFLVGMISMLGGSKPAIPPTPLPTQPAMQEEIPPGLTGKLLLTSVSPVAKVGSEVKLNLTIDGSNKLIDGADAVLVYDPTYLTFVGVSDESPRYLFPRKKDEKGRLIITALRNLDDTKVTSREPLATITFKAKKKGKATVAFEFFRGRTTGSTVIASAKSQNILGEVGNAQIEIQ